MLSECFSKRFHEPASKENGSNSENFSIYASLGANVSSMQELFLAAQIKGCEISTFNDELLPNVVKRQRNCTQSLGRCERERRVIRKGRGGSPRGHTISRGV